MSVIRIEKQTNYTTMANFHLRDKRLSLRAIGLLSKMLSLPPEWDYTVAGLAAICKEGKDAVRAALVELENTGYMVRQQTHSSKGTFSKNDYVVYEIPPLSGNPSTDNPTTVSPLSGNPSTDNPTEINTEINNNKNNNIPPIVPQGGQRKTKRAAKTEPDWKPERFEAFWEAYPRGENKQGAIAAWDKLHADDTLLRVMAIGLKNQLASRSWNEGIGIPYASTWLNKRRWEDELNKEVADEPPHQEWRAPIWT